LADLAESHESSSVAEVWSPEKSLAKNNTYEHESNNDSLPLHLGFLKVDQYDKIRQVLADVVALIL
jgi:hypothetical protein